MAPSTTSPAGSSAGPSPPAPPRAQPDLMTWGLEGPRAPDRRTLAGGVFIVVGIPVAPEDRHARRLGSNAFPLVRIRGHTVAAAPFGRHAGGRVCHRRGDRRNVGGVHAGVRGAFGGGGG